MSLSRLERREKVSYLLTQGQNETEIGKILQVSRRTVVRDVSFLKEASQRWLDDLIKAGFVFEAKLALEKLRDNEIRLRKLLKFSLEPLDEMKIIRQLDNNIISQLQMLVEGPTLYGMKKAMSAQDQKV